MPYPNWTAEERISISRAYQDAMAVYGEDWKIPEAIRAPYELLHSSNLANPAAVVGVGTVAQGTNLQQAAAAARAAELDTAATRAQTVQLMAQAAIEAAKAPPVGLYGGRPGADYVWQDPATGTWYTAAQLESRNTALQAAEIARGNVIFGGAVQEPTPGPFIVSGGQGPTSHATYLGYRPDEPTISNTGDRVSILSGIINGAKNLITGGTGKAMLTAGAQQLMDSRRDMGPGSPTLVAGMPNINMAGFTIPNIGTIASNVGKVLGVAGTVGTAATLAGGAMGLLGGGGPGAVMPEHKIQLMRRKCPKGYALGIDNYCYPKAMLPRKARKWKPDPRPVVSRADQKAINRAAAAKNRLVKITRDAGAYASVHKPTHSHTAARRKK